MLDHGVLAGTLLLFACSQQCAVRSLTRASLPLRTEESCASCDHSSVQRSLTMASLPSEIWTFFVELPQCVFVLASLDEDYCPRWSRLNAGHYILRPRGIRTHLFGVSVA